VRGTTSSGRSTSAQNRPFSAIPRNSMTRTYPPPHGKYHPGPVTLTTMLAQQAKQGIERGMERDGRTDRQSDRDREKKRLNSLLLEQRSTHDISLSTQIGVSSDT